MATPLDIGLLEKFSVIFPFLFVLVIVYAILQYGKFLGSNKGIHALIALFLAIMTLFSSAVTDTINLMAPWFILLFVFILFVIIAFKIFGTSDSDIMSVLKDPSYNYIIWWIVAIGLIIALGSLTSVVWSAESGGMPTYNESSAEGMGANAFWNTIFHPKILGMAVILLIAVFTIQKMTA